MSTKTIVKNNISKKISEYLNPDYVYVPYPNDYKLLVKTNQEVSKESPLLEKDGTVINTPVSGVIAGAKEAMINDGSTTNCIVITNNFKEKLASRKGIKRTINHYNKDEMINLLNSKGICDYYHNQKLVDQFKQRNEAKVLIVSGVDLEVDFYSDSFMLRDYSKEILETIDALAEIFEFKNVFLVMKNNDENNITKYTEYLGTYPNIILKLITSNYPSGLEHIIRKQLSNTLKEEDTVFLGVANVLAIYELLKRERTLTERYITITGPVVENPIVIKTKIGSQLKNIIKEQVKLIPTESIAYLANGSMSGIEIDLDSFIITPSTTGIYITKLSKEKESNCINCGKCQEICPVNINPKYIMDNYQDLEKIRVSRLEKCIHCGLCNEACPSRINLKNYLKKR